MIYVIAAIETVEGKREELIEAFRENMPLVRAEKGCIEYSATIDYPTNIPAQGPARDNIVTVVEKWERIDALEDHLMAPHMVEYRAKVKDIVVDVKLQILQPT